VNREVVSVMTIVIVYSTCAQSVVGSLTVFTFLCAGQNSVSCYIYIIVDQAISLLYYDKRAVALI
jgi:hypothetical protein